MEDVKQKAEYCLNCKVKPCQKGCPLENDIPEFIKNVKEENYEKAYQVMCKTTVLQSICGRICPHYSQCMGKCIRGIKSHPVSIGELEYFVGDLALKNKYSMDENICEKNNKKIAIIGSGPSGLTCAAFLARSGYSVTIYEKYKKLGGILRHGIPEFRLSKDILDDVIDKILSLGINVEYEKELGVNLDLKELEKNYDAVFIAIGANVPWNMGIKGEELNGVFGGNTLLERNEHPDYKGKNVAIIGGGNVAMDCARTINKMGANKVTVIYRRAEEQMPAEEKEIEDAKKEGIEFLFQTNIVKVIGDNENNVSKIECIKTELVKKDGESRLVPIDIENSNYELDMDYVIMAIGSTVEKNIIDKLGIECDKNGYIIVNENYETSIKNVFAGGDVIKNKATVAWAARNGRDVAKHIINNY